MDRPADVRFFVGDANDMTLACQPWVLVLFNPFGARTLERFVTRNLPVLRATKSLLCYCNDKHIDYFDAAGFEVLRNDGYNLSLVMF
jgi:hypothetical protein